MSDPREYITKVKSGEILACRQIHLAIARHENDLKTIHGNGYVFSENHGLAAINFIEKLLRFTKGKTAGQPVRLELWQKFHLFTLFGWRVDVPGYPRRFRKSYLEIPRKNGKTTLAAGVILYAGFFENEARAQNFTVATKREQAKICLTDAQAFVRNSPALNKALEVSVNKIVVRENRGKLTDENFVTSISSESSTQDGLDIHCAVVDELHAHKNRELLDLITTATGARKNPLVYMITTAGSNMESVCFEQRIYLEQILTGEVVDHSFHGMIFTLDKEDDFTDPSCWIKANPNLGVSKYEDYLHDQINQAKNMAGYENAVKRLDFNIWTSGAEEWIDRMLWNELAIEIDVKQFPYIYAGLDLAATSDFNALTIFFADPLMERYHQISYFWIPEDGLNNRKNNLPDLVKSARKHKRVIITPGNVMDDRRIAQDVIAICQDVGVQKLAYDPYHAHSGAIQDVVRSMGDDFCTPISQSIATMSEPTKQYTKLIMSKKLSHCNNPVFNWQTGNVKIYRDANDNIKMHKGKSHEKIDGPVSAVNAVAQYMSDSYEGFDSDLQNNDIFFI